MGKQEDREPPATMKPAAELTETDKQELKDLGIGAGPFNRIVTTCAAFATSDGWTVRKQDAKTHILWETKSSTHSKKQAMRFTATVPRCNAGSLEALLVDDPDFKDDPNVSHMYKYDRLLLQDHVEKRIAGNVTVQRSNYKAPAILAAPRQMMSYCTLAALLTPAQQTALGLRPRALKGQPAGAERHDNLMAFMQCTIDYTGGETVLRKGCELGHVHTYSVIGLEEPDGSLTVMLTMDMDPAGKLPAKVVDLASEEQHKKMQLIVDLLKAKGPQPHVCDVYKNTRDFPCHRGTASRAW